MGRIQPPIVFGDLDSLHLGKLLWYICVLIVVRFLDCLDSVQS